MKKNTTAVVAIAPATKTAKKSAAQVVTNNKPYSKFGRVAYDCEVPSDIEDKELLKLNTLEKGAKVQITTNKTKSGWMPAVFVKLIAHPELAPQGMVQVVTKEGKRKYRNFENVRIS